MGHTWRCQRSWNHILFQSIPNNDWLSSCSQASDCCAYLSSWTSITNWILWLEKQPKIKNGQLQIQNEGQGHEDVIENVGKRGRYSTGGDPPNKNIKKPKKGEVNYLPDFPDGHNATSLEMTRQLLADEMEKKKLQMESSSIRKWP